MYLGRSKRRIAGVAAVTAAALLAVGCGSSSSSPPPGSAGTKVTGGTVTMAEEPGAQPNWIWPFTPITNYSVYNSQYFQWLMYRPLYMFGNNGNSETVNYPLSPATAPVYSNGGKTVVVNMKGWKWSDGETVSAANVVFWLNMMEAEKANYAGYAPGTMPDNLVSYKATGPNQVTIQLDKGYSSYWFTYNQLAEITPMPLAWDVTSAGAKAGSGGCSADTASDKWAKCKAVYNFLVAQSKATSTYATSPIWGTVQHLRQRHLRAELEVLGQPEGDPRAVQGGAVHRPVGNIHGTEDRVGRHRPYPDGGPPAAEWHLPGAGDQPARIGLHPHALLPVLHLLLPAQLQQPDLRGGVQAALHPAGASVRGGPARHGQGDLPWLQRPDLGRGAGRTDQPVGSVEPDVQRRPGPVPVQRVQGHLAADQPRVEHGRRRDDQSFNTVIGESTPCKPGPKCTWDALRYGGWVFNGPGFEPTGEPLFQTGAGSNSGSYSNSQMDSLINQTHTSSSLTVFHNYAAYVAQQLPYIWLPADYYVEGVNSKLHNVGFNPFYTLLPEYWYFTK